MIRETADREDGVRSLSSKLDVALAEELRIASRLLNDLAYDLAGDPGVVRAHMGSLQAIDLVTQIQLCVANMLESDRSDEAKIDVSLEDMANRLRTACLPATEPNN